MNSADQERTFALFGRLQWHALRQALPGADIPPLGAHEFLAGLGDLAKEDDMQEGI